MSVRIMTAVWNVRLPDSEKIVLLALADCANDEGLCWPSMATLSAKCSKSDRTVQAAIKSLVAAGHMSRQENPGKGCRYIVHPAPEAASPPKPFRGETAAPPKRTTPTPEAASDKPSRTITSPKASPSSSPRKREPATVKPHRLPDDWRPARFPDGTVAREVADRRGREWSRAALESFRDWAANARDREGVGRKTDWQRAWANWIIEQDSRHGNRTDRRMDAQPDLRGSRPDPALDLLYAARAAEKAERAGGGGEDHRGTWPALPAVSAG